jgi:hypothetical protein
LYPTFLAQNIRGRLAPREGEVKLNDQTRALRAPLRAEQAKRNDRAFLPPATQQERGAFFFLTGEETSPSTSLRIAPSDPVSNLSPSLQTPFWVLSNTKNNHC